MAVYEIDSRETGIDFECGRDFRKRTVQNAKNLLLCRMGEVPFDRQRGIDPGIFDMPAEQAERILVKMLDKALMVEPDAEVVSARIVTVDGEPVIRCVIQVPDM